MESSTPSTSSGIASVDSNHLIRLCKLFNFNDGIPFFIANTYDCINDFLLNDDALIEFSLFCPNAMMSDAFLAKIRKYQHSLSIKQIPSSGHSKTASVENSIASSSSSLETSLAEDLPISSPVSSYSINNNHSFDFIKSSEFTLSGFKFPPMPVAFEILNNDQIDEAILRNCDLSDIFLKVAREIWSVIKPAYPNSVPQLTIHEICAIFTWEFKAVQANFEKIKNDQKIPSNIVDIGKYLKLKLTNVKRASAESKKRSGKWVYRKGQEHLAEKKEKKTKELLEANRATGRIPMKQRLAELENELQELQNAQRTSSELQNDQQIFAKFIPVSSVQETHMLEDKIGHETDSDDEITNRLRILEQRSSESRKSKLVSQVVKKKSKKRADPPVRRSTRSKNNYNVHLI